MRFDKFTENVLKATSVNEAIEQGLGGWMYCFKSESNLLSDAENYRHEWLRNSFKNHSIMKELDSLQTRLPADQPGPVLLKGASLIKHLYSNYGQRPMSDCDLLVEEIHLESLSKCLEGMGYCFLKEKKWQGNDFKKTFVKKKNGVGLVFEVHTRLFYHSKPSFLDAFEKDVGGYYSKLKPEFEFVHLCGHLGFQHTFRKLFWLLDIFLYLDCVKLDYQKVFEISKDWGVLNSVKAIAVLEKMWCGKDELAAGLNIKSNHLWMFSYLLKDEQLLEPLKLKWRYYLLKHKLKDNPYESYRYGVLWLIRSMQKK